MVIVGLPFFPYMGLAIMVVLEAYYLFLTVLTYSKLR